MKILSFVFWIFGKINRSTIIQHNCLFGPLFVWKVSPSEGIPRQDIPEPYGGNGNALLLDKVTKWSSVFLWQVDTYVKTIFSCTSTEMQRRNLFASTIKRSLFPVGIPVNLATLSNDFFFVSVASRSIFIRWTSLVSHLNTYEKNVYHLFFMNHLFCKLNCLFYKKDDFWLPRILTVLMGTYSASTICHWQQFRTLILLPVLKVLGIIS